MKLLICGTRSKKYDEGFVLAHLRMNYAEYFTEQKELDIIEGCCKDSADEYVERLSTIKILKIHHYPGNDKPLLRNIMMVKECDEVLAFWDGYSYGTAHTISHAVMNNKKIIIVRI